VGTQTLQAIAADEAVRNSKIQHQSFGSLKKEKFSRCRIIILAASGKVCWRSTCGLVDVLPIVAFLLAGTAAAQDRDRQENSCGLHDEYGKLRAGANPDLVIGACTAIIQSGQETTTGLSAASLGAGVTAIAYRVVRLLRRAHVFERCAAIG
jgi:hypothetical protein